jgi:hypothetical protein
MNKLIVLLSVLMMAMSVSAFAADDVVNPKLEQAKELRVQATKASMQADDLLKQAIALEIEANKPKPGEKMRGGNQQCYWDCLRDHHGDGYTCNRACGFY